MKQEGYSLEQLFTGTRVAGIVRLLLEVAGFRFRFSIRFGAGSGRLDRDGA
jgi:hypothetical protein